MAIKYRCVDIEVSTLRKNNKNMIDLSVNFIESYNDNLLQSCYSFSDMCQRERNRTQKQYFIFRYIFRLLYPFSRYIIRDEKPIGQSNIAKSTITGPRIATDKSCYGNHCRASMRLAFSSLRESSCWLPAVIQLLVRKHSQDARWPSESNCVKKPCRWVCRSRKRIQLLPFSLFTLAECIFDRL